MDNLHPAFKDAFKVLKPSTADCFYCKHPIALYDEPYIRTPTLETIVKKKPEAYAHELCAAEAEAEHLADKAWEEAQDYRDSMIELYGEIGNNGEPY